ncbi:MAG: hypothetical protein AAFW81_00985 [Pseudomonadota bacterium]
MMHRFVAYWRSLPNGRRITAGSASAYCAIWLLERGLTFGWEKILERQALPILQSIGAVLSSDIVIGMAIMAAVGGFGPNTFNFGRSIGVAVLGWIDAHRFQAAIFVFVATVVGAIVSVSLIGPYQSRIAEREVATIREAIRPRTLSLEKQIQITQIASNAASAHTIGFSAEIGCDECRNFAVDIASAFAKSDAWSIEEIGAVQGPPFSAAGLAIQAWDEINLTDAESLAKTTLEAAGYEVDVLQSTYTKARETRKKIAGAPQYPDVLIMITRRPHN